MAPATTPKAAARVCQRRVRTLLERPGRGSGDSTYSLACCGLPHHRRHARQSHRLRHHQALPRRHAHRQGHPAGNPEARDRDTAVPGSGADQGQDIAGPGGGIVGAAVVGGIDRAAVADSMKPPLLVVVEDRRCCCCCCCRFGCRSSSWWAMRKETIPTATIFGFAGFAGGRLVAQNVTDATSNTLYTRRGQADSPWYLVGRDVMRGPCGQFTPPTSRECLSACRCLHAVPASTQKPSLCSVAIRLNNGGRVATPLRIANLGGRPEPIYPFSSRRSPSALPRVPIRAGRQQSIPPASSNPPARPTDCQTPRFRARRGGVLHSSAEDMSR